ncbi:hypothetical protein [Streptomyces sp. F001]|uniref:hypothetical protein n=1 Tax=Streptomyces sp. F001 TaxID=1510026 RepID=UPI0013EE4BFC|nr:hypothetical protein [Streptomyces sp. F001]
MAAATALLSLDYRRHRRTVWSGPAFRAAIADTVPAPVRKLTTTRSSSPPASCAG